ncbi:hypothetical protein M427DRAFT_502525 [Gonapodya prolifera JEL478]|uniref:Uncharacterized protein n=1 Tax=Gonapodya prolifera (strain JEL478) TaxID=1344416 RepID=A0A139A6J4_GONPJ|nr:hypothetical protein M427DRAFT_502525 [Gonapodya prolifera JEL478]|eukprot:KXS12269.1 hypothetical protein M427DRAFT_502525 [Gonapodya prolifera JEL478]
MILTNQILRALPAGFFPIIGLIDLLLKAPVIARSIPTSMALRTIGGFGSIIPVLALIYTPQKQFFEKRVSSLTFFRHFLRPATARRRVLGNRLAASAIATVFIVGLEGALLTRLVAGNLLHNLKTTVVLEVLKLHGVDVDNISMGISGVLAGASTEAVSLGTVPYHGLRASVINLLCLPLYAIPVVGPLIASYLTASETSYHDLSPYLERRGILRNVSEVAAWMDVHRGDVTTYGVVSGLLLRFIPIVGDLAGAVGAALWAARADGLL